MLKYPTLATIKIWSSELIFYQMSKQRDKINVYFSLAWVNSQHLAMSP